MRAVWLREFGGPEVLTPGTGPDPVAGPGQVVVNVEFANITFVETRIRAGNGPFSVTLPTVPGNGVGGIVDSVGAGVDDDLVGTLVVTGTGGAGGYAERVAVAAAAVFRVPDGVALDAAVALLADGRTATMLTRAAAIKPGERVLVEAAAGGVGSLIVQLAAAAGARVIAAAGGPRKTAVATKIGADLAVDYRNDDWVTQVRDTVGAVDVVFDGVGGVIARNAFELLDRGGRMVSFGLASGRWAEIDADEAAVRGVTLVRPAATPAELREYTESALTKAAAGTLSPLIGQRFPLGQAAAAHAAIQSRATIGKTLLETG